VTRGRIARGTWLFGATPPSRRLPHLGRVRLPCTSSFWAK